MFGCGAAPRCRKGNGEVEVDFDHVERKAQNCVCETSGFPLGSLVFMVLSLEDSSDQAFPLNPEMMGKSWSRWG